MICWEPPQTDVGALREGAGIRAWGHVKTTHFGFLSWATVGQTAFLTKANVLGAFQKCLAGKQLSFHLSSLCPGAGSGACCCLRLRIAGCIRRHALF